MYYEDEYYDDDEHADEWENAIDDCGDTGHGWCMAAGTEYCQFVCPFYSSVFEKDLSEDTEQP